jgi:hypothetical protein
MMEQQISKFRNTKLREHFRKDDGVTTRTEELSVALVMSNIKEAHTISQVFKKVGVVPHYYETLEEFWFSLFESVPTLALVDVTKMSEGDLLLKNHPMIKAESVPLAFYLPKNSDVLLTSTFDLFHLGLIEQRGDEGSYQGQIKSLLKRLNKFHKIETERNLFKETGEKSERKIVKVIESHEKIKEKEFYNTLLKSMLARIELAKDSFDFEEALAKVFDQTHEVSAFSLLELSQSGHKLVSAEMDARKSKKIPSLWLGKACEDGIEFFAQNMAAQVGLELLGSDLVSLMIKGKAINPERIVIVKAKNEEILNGLDWESLEYALSGLYTHFAYVSSESNFKTSNMLTPWEFMSLLDAKTHGKRLSMNDSSLEAHMNSDYALVNIDFSDLINTIREKSLERFFFNAFFKDFWERFESQYRYQVKVSPVSLNNIAVLVDKNIADEAFIALKNYSLRYPYWKYFEDVDIVLTKNMKPTLQMVNFSRESYLRHIDAIEKVLAPREELKQIGNEIQQIVWGKAPTQSM